MMPSTPIPSNPFSRKSLPATSRMRWRFSATCSRLTLMAWLPADDSVTLDDDRHLCQQEPSGPPIGECERVSASIAAGADAELEEIRDGPGDEPWWPDVAACGRARLVGGGRSSRSAR